MRVFATRWFSRFAKSERLSDSRLCEAVDRAGLGLLDADLGRGLIKQRLSRPGQGRRGGYRVLIAYRAGERAVFLYGFAKNERDNINARQLADWQARAQEVLAASDELIEQNIADDHLREVYCDQEEKA
jgi:hypothetical protein